ncbi:LOW QUALITY PROTEIN: hypothetical protein FGSG_11783 [Fusarium graminearum PH-1]|uniref:hypothetical protein n=1 Tax=Gibberella zeae (strain ATCC MYA-4620 / CBS 123657 / FGSC 9075 / NRRL 31084 / PH-1) TaxID=229533 RepID=UPI00021F2463|nr:LOW QUALITY PROTEIN: hypothetical protein FGSG_11783 [Fusarium graminearum PH-1]ESU05762.1 LOW QUALITY PROTEIN: hypothetical protein FGSG_11783 [Fusarium graminearum PH-1]|eukprot:XP_011316247.1 LOW QUALITY PROTEIN: hypothetical protein FGSG_11783 [Fusarium graminearum PH-1]
MLLCLSLSLSKVKEALQPHLGVSVTNNPVPGNEYVGTRRGDSREKKNQDWSKRVPCRTTVSCSSVDLQSNSLPLGWNWGEPGFRSDKDRPKEDGVGKAGREVKR